MGCSIWKHCNTYRCNRNIPLKKNKWLAPVPPIVANTIIVPFVLKFAYGSEGMFAMFFVTVGAGEIIVCGIIGMILLYALTPVRHVIFGDEK